MSANPCPVCGHPIADTAYVCAGCGDTLTAALTAAVGLWRDSETTLTRQAHLAGTATTSAGPASAETGPGQEPPLSGEPPMPMHYGASEARFVLTNTVTTWARHVAETRGIPVPVTPRPQRSTPSDGWTSEHRSPVDDDLCPLSDLPPDQCACPRHTHPTKDTR